MLEIKVHLNGNMPKQVSYFASYIQHTGTCSMCILCTVFNCCVPVAPVPVAGSCLIEKIYFFSKTKDEIFKKLIII